MSSLYMHQLVKSMVNWNMYNDNIMTSDVSYLKNSRSSQVYLLVFALGVRVISVRVSKTIVTGRVFFLCEWFYHGALSHF